MTKRRQRFSTQVKFEVALEAASGLRTINQIASDHGIHPNQVSQWRKQLLEEGPTVFTNVTARRQREQEAQEAELYEQIGRLKMELEWLKKKAARGS